MFLPLQWFRGTVGQFWGFEAICEDGCRERAFALGTDFPYYSIGITGAS